MNDRMENIALKWLAWEKKCVAVMHERTPRERACGQPDVLGLTRARYLIEIEIKRSVADFKKNADKRHIVNRDHCLERQPRQFYFFVPEKIADQCGSLCPEWAGLAMLKGHSFEIIRTAPVNAKSKRLSNKECVVFFHKLSNQVVTFSDANENLKTRFTEGCFDNYPLEKRYSTEPIWSYTI